MVVPARRHSSAGVPALDMYTSHQRTLPKLPVPPLVPTLNKYLESVQPLVTPEEFKKTKKIVEEFVKPTGLGPKLHSLLEEKAARKENWLSQWWLYTAYLEFRMPVVVHSSPGLVFPLQKFKSRDEQLRYAAKLISGALDFKRLLDKQAFPPEKAGMAPLDMSQYFKLFGTCRVPSIPSDQLLIPSAEGKWMPVHIVVCHRNHFYQVYVCHDDGTPLKEGEILSQLEQIVELTQKPAPPTGILTTEHRDVWAKSYMKLFKDEVNRKSIKKIQNSLFVLCLDEPVPRQQDVSRISHAGLQLIHGMGPRHNAANRWFDKTIQFVVGADGIVGLTYEHSPAEGPPLTSLMDHIVYYIENHPDHAEIPSSSSWRPKELIFHLTPRTMEDIHTASRDLEVLVDDLQLTAINYAGFGKDFIKSQKLSPDSFIQMAIQLSFYRVHSQPTATYETASTRMYLHGRTETIRSCSMQSLNFCKAWLETDRKVSAKEKIFSLRQAVEAHKKYAIEAGQGFGVDRYLLALKKLAVENGLNVPPLFLDQSYSTSTHFRLSTSQVPSKVQAFMCYGPLVPDGYGCCYNPFPNSMIFAITAFNSTLETDANKLKDALTTSLDELHETLAKNQSSKL